MVVQIMATNNATSFECDDGHVEYLYLSPSEMLVLNKFLIDHSQVNNPTMPEWYVRPLYSLPLGYYASLVGFSPCWPPENMKA